jgi:catalase
MRFANRPGQTNYAPNSLAGTPQEAPAKKEGYVHYPAPVSGVKTRERSKTFSDHYTQAALFYNSLTTPEQEHIGQAFTVELSKVSDAKIKKLMLEHLAKIDQELAANVAGQLGMHAPKGAVAARAGKSKGLSQEEGPKDSIKSRKIAILAADGVTSTDVKRMAASLKKEGATAEVIAMRLGEFLKGDVKADKSFATADSTMYDAVYVPGGKESVTALLGEERVRNFVRQAYDHGKALAASGEGVDLFHSVGVGGAPGVVLDKEGNDGVKSFIAAIAQHRHWNRAKLSPLHGLNN